MQVNKTVYYTKLLDIYGNMLTPKQHAILTDYLCFDNTLSEIAQAHKTTRQAVKDIINRTCLKLDEFEQKLHYSAKTQQLLVDLKQILAKDISKEVKAKIEQIIKSMEV